MASLLPILLIVAGQSAGQADLAKALTLHASFDTGLDADGSTGARECWYRLGKDPLKAAPNAAVVLAKGEGKFGGGLVFPKKGNSRPQYKGRDVLGYNDKNWSATVSVWLRLDPDKDLEPGYCDPVQVVGNDTRKGYVFLEWSKDETPRYFRYAIRPLFPIWNPDNVPWADIPFHKRPMVQVAKAPFSRDRWTHVVFTLENINDKPKKPSGRLYIDGKSRGAIENWDLTFAWDPDSVALVLGAAYVGRMDDLAVFGRVLTAAEVTTLHQLKNGVADLRAR
ncbi:MAG: LamG-like jellyroll fold domain-containing protein [Planctomycetaceae bacterium]